MPIEINEAGAGSVTPPGAAGSSATSPPPDALLEQSVEQVLDILRAKKER